MGCAISVPIRSTPPLLVRSLWRRLVDSALRDLYVKARWAMAGLSTPLERQECLEALAAYLAVSLGRDAHVAVDRTTEQYQAELGAEHCTLEQARELRRLTVKACVPEQESDGAVLADLDAVADSMPRGVTVMKFAMGWAAALIVVGLAVL